MKQLDRALGIAVPCVLAVVSLLVITFRPSVSLMTEGAPGDSATPTAVPRDDAKTASGARIAGVDVSHYQGRIDWARARHNGVEFAYLKATEGTHYTDPFLTTNAEALHSLGIPFGAYHFFDPRRDASLQADHFIAVARKIQKTSLPPAIDVETLQGVDPKELRREVETWIRRVAVALDCRPVLYTSGSFWRENLGPVGAPTGIWIADYSDRLSLPNGIESWIFWQHSPSGRLDGFRGKVDLDWFNGDSEAISRLQCRRESE